MIFNTITLKCEIFHKIFINEILPSGVQLYSISLNILRRNLSTSSASYYAELVDKLRK